ncbi:DUF2087 domain-containing protein [Fusibacter sp. JL298sf-3]
MLTQEERKIVDRFLDDEGRVKLWPSKRSKQNLIYKYLTEAFDSKPSYTEFEVNCALMKAHTFGDHFLLRRGLIDEGYLKREKDGSVYYRCRKS